MAGSAPVKMRELMEVAFAVVLTASRFTDGKDAAGTWASGKPAEAASRRAVRSAVATPPASAAKSNDVMAGRRRTS